MRSRAVQAIILCALSVFPAFSQVIVEPDVVTDSIDVFSGSTKPTKSRAVAGFTSLLLPGLGHHYLGNSRRGLAYFGAEALFACGLVFSERYSNRLFNNSRSYASMYASISSALDGNDYFWQNVGRFDDADEYNRIMELNRTPADKYTQREEQWRWMDTFYRDEYNGIRESATRFHVASSFFIAAMVLNRVVAFIDIRRSTKYQGVQGHTGFMIQPHYRSGSEGLCLTFAGRF